MAELGFATSGSPGHPECPVLQYEEITANPPHQVLGISSKEEYLASLDAFRVSEAARRLTPNRRDPRVAATHGDRSTATSALTARPLASAGVAAEWVFRHFGNYIRCFGVVPSRLDPGRAAL